MTLQELKELAEKATPGPWTCEYVGGGSSRYEVVTKKKEPYKFPTVATTPGCGIEITKDMELIAAARNHIAELIERVKKLSDVVTLMSGYIANGCVEQEPERPLSDAVEQALELYGAERELKK